MRLVITSLFGDPLHKGHLECLQKAKELGDYLLVFVDSDRKAVLKKGYVFMPEEERLSIIKSLKCVDEAIIVDSSIADALSGHYNCIFAKGGDRTIDNLPQEEIDICKSNNISIVCGLGDKIQASSTLIRDLVKNSRVKDTRPWGKYEIIDIGEGYKIKKITVNPKSSISLQSHNHRSEHWVVIKGIAHVQMGEDVFYIPKGNSVFIPKKVKHRLINNTNELLEIIEVQNGEYLEEDDIIRYEDIYGRVIGDLYG